MLIKPSWRTVSDAAADAPLTQPPQPSQVKDSRQCPDGAPSRVLAYARPAVVR
ncbi:hypothetical protein GCM10009835_44830 [Planosporangium flavigriseum]|uniref:Uncharacterized protein n=1 Tax=Planosporangium flavigriseum TaxID=373681 RepID=A0A8J3LEK0_9ACTN|nr:hypothetical protein Pfl04_00560 [Planosporangium flavigriseum]